MISLVIPPKDQVSRIVKMLADEYGTASNIKSRVNRYVSTAASFQYRSKVTHLFCNQDSLKIIFTFLKVICLRGNHINSAEAKVV